MWLAGLRLDIPAIRVVVLFFGYQLPKYKPTERAA